MSIFISSCHGVDEDIVITYSYWDGTGHRKVVKVGNGTYTTVLHAFDLNFALLVFLETCSDDKTAFVVANDFCRSF